MRKCVSTVLPRVWAGSVSPPKHSCCIRPVRNLPTVQVGKKDSLIEAKSWKITNVRDFVCEVTVKHMQVRYVVLYTAVSQLILAFSIDASQSEYQTKLLATR